MSEFSDYVKSCKLKPPFKLEESGNYILDSNNVIVMQIRGWGHFQYLERGPSKQDNFAKYVLGAINKELNL